MRKMPTLFVRDFTDRRRPAATREVTPGCEWVLAGEGRPTRKLDGTCVLIKDRAVFKRYDAKHGKTPPPAFVPAQPDPDPITGHWPGWLPIGPRDYWHHEALEYTSSVLPDGTYELVGPKVNGNPEGKWGWHVLIRHGSRVLHDVPRDFDGLRDWFAKGQGMEGVVWHHLDGRMVKLKASDFGLARDGSVL